MNKKHLLVLAIIFVVLGLGIVFKSTQEPAEISLEEFDPLNIEISEEQVSRLIISSGEDQIADMEKVDSDWLIRNFHNALADKQKIELLIKELSEATGELRGKDENIYEDFGITNPEAIQVQFLDADGNSALHVYIGTLRPRSDRTFLRLNDSPVVYAAKSDPLAKMGYYKDPKEGKPTVDYWPDRVLAVFDDAEVESIVSHRKIDGTNTLTTSVHREADPDDATKKRWIYDREALPFPLDVSKIKTFLSGMKNWKASGVKDPEAEGLGFDDPEFKMVLTLEGGEKIEVLAGNKVPDKNRFYMKSTTTPIVFEVPDYYYRNFSADDSKFFATDPLGISTVNLLEDLALSRAGMEYQFEPAKKSWASLETYINNKLKKITPARLLFGAETSKAKASGDWILVKVKDKDPAFLDLGEQVKGRAGTVEYAMKLRNSTQAFTITESSYKLLFDGLDSLKDPDVS